MHFSEAVLTYKLNTAMVLPKRAIMGKLMLVISIFSVFALLCLHTFIFQGKKLSLIKGLASYGMNVLFFTASLALWGLLFVRDGTKQTPKLKLLLIVASV